MKAYVRVSIDTGYDVRETRAVEIDGPFLQAFEPMDRVDEPLAVVFGHGAKMESCALVIMRRREGFAAILAKAITEQLVQAMNERDKVNGYPIAEMQHHVLAKMRPLHSTDRGVAR